MGEEGEEEGEEGEGEEEGGKKEGEGEEEEGKKEGEGGGGGERGEGKKASVSELLRAKTKFLKGKVAAEMPARRKAKTQKKPSPKGLGFFMGIEARRRQ